MRLDQPTAFRNRTRAPARYLAAVVSERVPVQGAFQGLGYSILED
jgi:hypothetical protein